MTTTTEPPNRPTAVPRFEYNLLRILRFVLGHAPADQVAPLIHARLQPAPPCLGADCVRLAKDTLAKGVVSHLVHAGGWRREHFLRNDKPVGGRVWDRIPLDERRLEFGPAPLDFLIWLTAERPTDPTTPWDVDPTTLTSADELFFALAYQNLRTIEDLAVVFAGKATFRENALCWLYEPGDFATAAEPTPPAFGPWVAGPRAVILECLQPALTRRWVRRDREKSQIDDWRRMREQGRAESAALDGFLTAAHAAGRTDLARFVLRALSTLLRSPDIGPDYWTGGLRAARPQRLADRIETLRVALALVGQAETLQQWERAARSVGYFDDGYAASQFWKADWEAADGDVMAAAARRVLDALEPLRPS